MATRKSKQPLTRCSGTMNESQYLAWIRSALRSKWLRWQPRNDCLKAARRSYKGPNKRQLWEYQCALCTEWFISKEMEVDHYPHDAGTILSVADIGPFTGRLFCETDNLRAVCKTCHKIHTYAQAEGITFEESRAAKLVIEITKQPVKKVLEFLAQHGYNSAPDVSNATKRKELVTKILKGNT